MKNYLKFSSKSLVQILIFFTSLWMLSCQTQKHNHSNTAEHDIKVGIPFGNEKIVKQAYPQVWIHQTIPQPNRLCKHLVYKDGCNELRVGKVVFDIQITQSGKVQQIKQVSNTVQTDLDMVKQCFIKQVEKLSFPPPTEYENHFTITLNLSSRC